MAISNKDESIYSAWDLNSMKYSYSYMKKETLIGWSADQFLQCKQPFKTEGSLALLSLSVVFSDLLKELYQ